MLASHWSFLSILASHWSIFHTSGDDGECSTPHSVEGECVPLRQCEPVMSLLRGGMTQQKMVYIRRSMCKFTGMACDNAALWKTRQTLHVCSLDAFSSIPDGSRGLFLRLNVFLNAMLPLNLYRKAQKPLKKTAYSNSQNKCLPGPTGFPIVHCQYCDLFCSGSTPDVCCPEEAVSLSWSGWAPWSTWSQCSARCGGGVARRRRSCQGRDCRGADRDQRSQQRPCNEHTCGESKTLIPCLLIIMFSGQPSMVAGAGGPPGQSAVTVVARARGPGPGPVTPRPPHTVGPRVSGTRSWPASV